MAKQPHHDWYLREWLASLGVRFPHAWLQKELDYSDGKASNVLGGKKRYDRDIVNEVATAMKILPHELLMHPDEAMALRRLRLDAARIADTGPSPSMAASTKRKAG